MDYAPVRYRLYKVSEKIFKRVRTLVRNKSKRQNKKKAKNKGE